MSESIPTPQQPSVPAGTAEPINPAGQSEQSSPRRRHRDPVADAAKYRHQLRETQAERDQIAQVAQAAQSAAYDEITKALRVKGQSLTHPDDLQRFTGKSAGDYLNEDGTLDRDALQADFDKLRADRPELFHSINYMPRPDRSQGHGGDYSAGGQRWADAFRTRK